MKKLSPVCRFAGRVALELGAFRGLESGALDVNELAATLQVAPRGLLPLLYTLTSVGLLEEKPDRRFELAPGAASFLCEGPPVAPPGWERLAEAVRTGRNVYPAIEGEDDDGQFFVPVVDTLFALHAPAARLVAEALPDTARRALDLGAGSAVWSLGLSRLPELEVVAVDRARVLERVTARFVAEHGRGAKYELRAGSYREMEFEEAAYDVVYLGHVLHSEGRAVSELLLENARRALRPGGFVVVAEMVGSDPRSLDLTSNLFELNMLMYTEDGCVFSRLELEEMATRAGLTGLRWVSGGGQYPVLLASRPAAEA